MDTESYKIQKVGRNISIIGLALSSVAQLLLPWHFDGFAIAFGVMYLAAEYKMKQVEKGY